VKFGWSGTVIDVYGSLISNGTAEHPVTFTAYADDSVGGDTNGDASSTLPVAGSWQAIVFAPASTGNFSYTNIRYGGAQRNGIPSTWTMVSADSPAALSFDHVELSDSITHGMMLSNAATGTVTFTHSAFLKNTKAGLHLDRSTPTLSTVHFGQNTYGIYAEDDASHPLATDVTFEGNLYKTMPEDLLP
jgi:hypothetical protein